MISGGATNDDSNWAQKRYNQVECMTITMPVVESGPLLGFGSGDMEASPLFKMTPW